MSYGFKIINNADSLLIDDTLKTYTTHFIRNATANGNYPSVGTNFTTATGALGNAASDWIVENALYFVRRSDDPPGIISLMGNTYCIWDSGAEYNSARKMNIVHLPGDYHTWTVATFLPISATSGAPHGIRVFDGAGQAVFDSGNSYFSVVATFAVQVTSAGPASQIFTFNHPQLPAANLPYFFCATPGITLKSGTTGYFYAITGISTTGVQTQIRVQEVLRLNSMAGAGSLPTTGRFTLAIGALS